MKIIYMGTPDFAVLPLVKLSEKHEIAAVVTRADKPKGRGHEMASPPVKVEALKRGIPVFQPITLKDGALSAMLSEIKPDVIVVCAYGKILPKYVLDAPKYGCINIHASLLPKYRGAAPINRCVINGEKESGITIMQMDEGLDTGDMLLQKRVPITENTTAGSLHDELSVLGADAVVEALDLIENGKASPVKQTGESCYAPMIDKETCKIDFSTGKKAVAALIKGLSPYPAAWFTLEGKVMKPVFAVCSDDVFDVGVIPDGKELKIGTGDGSVIITKVRPEGKKEMDGVSFMAGRRQRGGNAQ